MGLDSYLYAASPFELGRVNDGQVSIYEANFLEIAYWRKAYDVDSFFRERGKHIPRTYEYFVVALDDLDAFEAAVTDGTIETVGFCDYTEAHKDAVAKGRDYASKGFVLIYYGG